MLNILSSYFKLIKKYQYNYFWIITMYIILPLILSTLPLILKYFEYPCVIKEINTFITSWSSEIISLLVLLSWFLLTSITMILSNSKVEYEALKRISEKKKITEEETITYLEWLKWLLMYEIIMQFILIVLSTFFIILTKITTNIEITTTITLLFIILSSFWLYRLLLNFTIYQKNTSFKTKI